MHKPKTPLHQKRWTLRLFEWGVLVCVILILMGVFLRKVRDLQVEAERLKVQAAIDNMRAAVLLISILNKDSEVVRNNARSGGNPVALLKSETGMEPEGYVGELENADPHGVRPGQWYYDRGAKALIYRLQNGDGFVSPLPGPPHIRVCLGKTEGEGLGKSALVLEPCERYQWGKHYY